MSTPTLSGEGLRSRREPVRTDASSAQRPSDPAQPLTPLTTLGASDGARQIGGVPALLREWRNGHSWSPARAARRFCVAKSVYLAWEHGQVSPPYDQLLKVARDTGRGLPELVLAAGIQPVDLPAPVAWLPGELPSLLGHWRHREGLSYVAAGRRVAASETTFASWENGRVPGPRFIRALAWAMGASEGDVRRAAGADRVRRPATSGGPETTPLARARFERGMNQRQLSRAINVSPSLVSLWESGCRRPHSRFYPLLAQALGMSCDDVAALFVDYPPLPSQELGRLTGLAFLRRRTGQTQAQLARSVGVGTSTIAAWESGRRPVPGRRANDLARCLDVPTERLAKATAAPLRVVAPVSALRRLRGRAHLTTTTVASRVGVSARTLTSWECGERLPTWPQARALAEVYGVPLKHVCDAVGLSPSRWLDRRNWQSEALPQVLREIRYWAGISAEQLGERTGRAASTIRGWERGVRRPSREALGDLEGALGLKPGSLTAMHVAVPRGRGKRTKRRLDRASTAPLSNIARQQGDTQCPVQ